VAAPTAAQPNEPSVPAATTGTARPAIEAQPTWQAIIPTVERLPDVEEDCRVTDAVQRRATARVRSGFRLASRGALFTARAEFIRALRLVSQALDAPRGGLERGRALAAGLQALAEADDFVPRGADLEANLDLAGLIAAHRTPVLKEARPDELSAPLALGRYLTYAQGQLATAAGHEPAGSMALYGLAQVCSTLGSSDSDRHRVAEQKAVSLHQAALRVRPDNPMAANELGVLLTRYGYDDAARRVFEQSLRSAPSRAAWHNLAVLHEQMGQTALAAEARRQAARVGLAGADRGLGALTPEVRWLDPTHFARTGAATDRPTWSPATGRAPPPDPARPAPSAARQRAVGWIPWSKQRN
jgi:tetratricopeptide (TPR) repeat protein